MLAVPAFIWLLASTLFCAVGEYLSKKWGMNPSWTFAFLVTGVYAIGAILWLPALLHKNQLAIMGTIWALMTAVLTVAIGLFVFHESLSITQTIGILLALISLGLLWM